MRKSPEVPEGPRKAQKMIDGCRRSTPGVSGARLWLDVLDGLRPALLRHLKPVLFSWTRTPVISGLAANRISVIFGMP